jgi:hypothetical protein
MDYQLEIYRPGTSDSSGRLKVFTAAAPFEPIRVGELINTKEWANDTRWSLLRVVNVEHLISESSATGIDPAGRITQRLLIYTESAPDTAETRCKSD